MGRSLKLGGRSALALRLLLAGVSKRLSASAGVATGEEFRAARKAAEALGAQIVLGDRPIEITGMEITEVGRAFTIWSHPGSRHVR